MFKTNVKKQVKTTKKIFFENILFSIVKIKK